MLNRFFVCSIGKDKVAFFTSLILALLLFLLPCKTSYAQKESPSQWIRLMNDNSSSQVLSALRVYNSLDTLHPEQAAHQLDSLAKTQNKRIKARAKAISSRFLFYWLGPGDSLYAAGMKEALAQAYAINDPYMIAEFSRWYGEMLNSLGNAPLAAQYCMNSVKMQEELGFTHFTSVKNFFLTTAEMLYRTINHKEAVSYYTAAFRLPDDSLNPRDYYYYKQYFAQSLNTLGRSYYYLKQYDSSVYWLHQCMKYVKESRLPDDIYLMASDNRFDPYIELEQYDSCRKIADDLYQAGLPNDSAALMAACFMKGRIAIRTGQHSEALKWAMQSETYAGGKTKPLFHVYKDIIAAYEALGERDKALLYYKKFQQLEDVNNEVKKKAGAAFLEAESEYQKSKVALTRTTARHKNQLRLRNIAIGAVVLLAAGIVLFFNRKRKKSERAHKEAEERFHFFEKKYRTADEQLHVFKQEAAAKNRQIDELLARENKKERTREEVGKIDGLSRQIILTEEDWKAFKENFDSVYPGFATALKHKAPDITNAELRMACLIRLNFDSRHIAGMLGISQISVRKTRYRLKKRFADENEASLEEIIAAV